MIPLKTSTEIKIMAEGGRKLARVKNFLAGAVKEGVNALEIENLADKLIAQEGGKASFKMVPGYSWATCVNVNDGLVHGIPSAKLVFRKGDVVSVDIGMFYKGFHTDTSFSVAIEPSPEVARFLAAGQSALRRAISETREGKRIWDISRAIEETIRAAGYSPIRALVGHGVGRELHEEPQIPCFLPAEIENSPLIKAGMVLAIEVMYAAGGPDVILDADGWTIATRDGRIAGLFEETVAVTALGPQIITQ